MFRPYERDEQVTLVEWCRLVSGTHPELARIFAIPNSALRRGHNARRMVEEGVRSTVPDLCLPVARGGYHALFLEMKRIGEKPSVDQAKELAQLAADGYLATWAAGCGAAQRVLLDYLKLPAYLSGTTGHVIQRADAPEHVKRLRQALPAASEAKGATGLASNAGDAPADAFKAKSVNRAKVRAARTRQARLGAS